MRPRNLTIIGLSATILAIAGPAWAGGGGHATCPAFSVADSDGIELRDSCIAPVSAVADAGSTVTVTNAGTMGHTYTAVDGSFDTGVVQPGGSATLELPDTPGTLPVYCTLHADRSGNGMAGTLTLELLATEPVSAAAGGIASSGIPLAGGFILGFATIAAFRRRSHPSAAAEVQP